MGCLLELGGILCVTSPSWATRAPAYVQETELSSTPVSSRREPSEVAAGMDTQRAEFSSFVEFDYSRVGVPTSAEGNSLEAKSGSYPYIFPYVRGRFLVSGKLAGKTAAEPRGGGRSRCSSWNPKLIQNGDHRNPSDSPSPLHYRRRRDHRR